MPGTKISGSISINKKLFIYGAGHHPDSLQIIKNAVVEPSLANAPAESRYQFIRKGYFCLDKDSTADKLVFNSTVTLKDAWAKEVKKS